MKLYLSSMMIGDHTDVLLDLVGGRGGRLAVITNALDAIPLEAQLHYAQTCFDPLIYFRGFGFDASLLDLRNYFGRTDDLRTILYAYQAVWCVGCNSFLLRRAMRDSGFDGMVSELLEAGMVYAGWSAGACVAGDGMDAVALMDAPDLIAPGYQSTAEPVTGLGLVPFTIIPHFQSDHPEAPLAATAVNWAKANNINHLAMRDGDVVIRRGANIEVLSRR